MTNRERFLKKLLEMDNKELARVLCDTNNCDECPARDKKHCCDGIKAVAEWLGKEEKDDLTD